MKKLQEKLLLEEPEDIEAVEMSVDELPPVELDKPIEIEEPQVSEEDKSNSFIDVLSMEMSETYNDISSLKSILTTLNNELSNRDDIKDILNTIVDERAMHVGMLQKAIELLNEEHKELVDAGEEKAEAIASEPSNELEEPSNELEEE